jgi:hypothetical protein
MVSIIRMRDVAQVSWFGSDAGQQVLAMFEMRSLMRAIHKFAQASGLSAIFKDRKSQEALRWNEGLSRGTLR